jgi:HlyD family secretion protein
MKKGIIIWIVLILALAGAATWFFGFRKAEKPPVIETDHPQVGYISQSVTATGKIEPVDTVSVGTQVSGTIKYVYADFNSKVKKGQLVAELDKSLLQAQVNQNLANVAVMQSQYDYQKSNFDRQSLLFQTGAISKADFENAQYQQNSSKASLVSAQAQLQASEKNLSYASIYSPVDGVVLQRNVNIGQTVASSFNTPTLYIIAKDITKMQVQAAVDEADIGNVSVNQNVTFTVDAFPDDLFSGTVKEIRLQPSVSANVVTYTTIVNAANDNLKLKPGMTASIIIYTKEEDSALLIPAKALKFKPDSSLSKYYKLIYATADSMRAKTTVDSASAIKQKVAAIHPKRDSTMKKGGDNAARAKQRGVVWVKSGDSLIQKRIRIGLNDDTEVQVIHGLRTSDEVITGIQVTATQPGAKGAVQRSPFMPQRARPNNPRAGGNRQ